MRSNQMMSGPAGYVMSLHVVNLREPDILCRALNSHCFPMLGMVINLIVLVYITHYIWFRPLLTVG